MTAWLLLLLLQAPAVDPASAPTTTVRLKANEYLVGPVTLEAMLSPESTPVTRADFLVDGVLACRVAGPPLQCRHDFGSQLRRHRVQVVVTLTTGQRVTAMVDSKAVDLDETVSVQNVFLPVVVTDRRGRFINGLTQQSFEVLEDDVSQNIQFFAAESAPLDVALALDISASMTPLMDSVKAAAKAFLGGLATSDHVSLLAFNQRVFVVTSTDNPGAPQTSALVDRLHATGGTALFDTLTRAAGMLGTDLRRRAIVIFTDGKDEHSVSTFEEVDRDLAARDAVLYVMTFGRAPGIDQQRTQLYQLAERTGGRGFTLEKPEEIGIAFKEILATLSHHYLIGYTPSRAGLDGRFRKVTVRLTGRDPNEYRVRARSGYRAVPPASP